VSGDERNGIYEAPFFSVTYENENELSSYRMKKRKKTKALTREPRTTDTGTG